MGAMLGHVHGLTHIKRSGYRDQRAWILGAISKFCLPECLIVLKEYMNEMNEFW